MKVVQNQQRGQDASLIATRGAVIDQVLANRFQGVRQVAIRDLRWRVQTGELNEVFDHCVVVVGIQALLSLGAQMGDQALAQIPALLVIDGQLMEATNVSRERAVVDVRR